MIYSKELEEKTLEKMIQIYCRNTHGSFLNDCAECRELMSYARERLARCPFGEKKPVCAKCPVHCYKPGMRGRIKAVMRHSGPKMIFKSPLLTLRYVFRKMLK